MHRPSRRRVWGHPVGPHRSALLKMKRTPAAALTVSRRECIGLATAAATWPSMAFAAAPTRYITPEEFGAVGDGITNDTDAFAAMSERVTKEGGGVIFLRATTYVVGKQAPERTQTIYSFPPSKIMEFSGCNKKLTIIGNGACLRCADGLRYGTFNASTALATFHPLPNYNPVELATPYAAMIKVQNCSGGIEISDIELDGNIASLIIGGPFGDTGHQIPAFGLQLINNNCAEQVSQIYTHHHALDGLHASGFVGRASSSMIRHVISEYNARQGCSLTGGCNYSFVNCRFSHTGRAGLATSPGAGVDIEAEDKTIRNVSFTACEFSNNVGAGMIADSGDTDGGTFNGCRFIGATHWSAWPAKPNFRFANCQFVGAICNTFGDPDPQRAVQFSNCDFLDDPALSPTRQVYTPLGPIADLWDHKNVLFDDCRFKLTAQCVLPWTLSVLYNNCSLSQTQAKQAYPRGTFTGVNTISGNVDLYGSRILGELTVNGRLIARTG